MIIKKNSIWEPIQRRVNVASDGIPGPQTLFGISAALGCFEIWSAVQAKVGVKADGVPGVKTALAVAGKLKISAWPTQAEVRSGASIFGYPGDESNLVSLSVPYPLFLSWEKGTVVTNIRCHRLIAQPLLQIFQKTLEAYGSKRIGELGLNLFGGCFNNRSVAGGKSKSIHAWGVAVDLDPDHNGLNTRSPKARFSGEEYETFWNIVEEQGGVSLGRKKDFDWMHFQFARL